MIVESISAGYLLMRHKTLILRCTEKVKYIQAYWILPTFLIFLEM